MRQRQGVQRLRGALDEIRPLAQSNLLTLPRGAGTLGSTSDSLTETSLAKRMLFFTSVGISGGFAGRSSPHALDSQCALQAAAELAHSST